MPNRGCGRTEMEKPQSTLNQLGSPLRQCGPHCADTPRMKALRNEFTCPCAKTSLSDTRCALPYRTHARQVRLIALTQDLTKEFILWLGAGLSKRRAPPRWEYTPVVAPRTGIPNPAGLHAHAVRSHALHAHPVRHRKSSSDSVKTLAGQHPGLVADLETDGPGKLI